MNMIVKAVIGAAVIFSAVALAGCGVAGGNSKSDIDEAMQSISQQYGVVLKLKKKRPTGGANCNIVVTSDKTGSKEIRVFRFEKRYRVNTDYIFVRYGDEAYKAIQNAAQNAEPGCRVIVRDLVYNHFPNASYDSSTDLDAYLADNDFAIKVFVQGKFTKEELIAEYKNLALSMKESGINCKCFYLYAVDTKEQLDLITVPDHITHENETYPETGEGKCNTVIYSCYRSLAEYCDDPDNIEDVLIKIDGEVVKRI